MEIYLILFILVIGIVAGLLFWIYKLYRLYKKGNRRSFTIQVSFLVIIAVFFMWQLGLYPYAKNLYIRERTEALTGQSFWSWEDFSYEDISVRGEGYTLNIFEFNNETAKYFSSPEPQFYNLPKENTVKWTPTPVSAKEQEILEFATPDYADWKGEIIERQNLIRKIANSKGSFYSYREKGTNNTDFYLICPERKLIILINHNM